MKRSYKIGELTLKLKPAFLSFAATIFLVVSFGSAIGQRTYKNPVITGMNPDPSICRVGDDFYLVASTKLSFVPEAENEEAGLVVRGNDANHFSLLITQREGKRVVLFRKHLQNRVESEEYKEIPKDDVILKIIATELEYNFWAQPKGKKAILLGTAATKDISNEKIHGFIGLLLVLCVQAQESKFIIVQTDSEPIVLGKFEPTWESLSQYEVPEWFRNAKFGIWAHWGPQCQPEMGDWYGRGMYIEGSWQYNFHVRKYGHPSNFGFKDVINDWKAENWNPEKLVALYKRVGARYFFAMANHHDNLENLRRYCLGKC